MLLKISDFCLAADTNLNGLIARLAGETSRLMTDNEKRELAESYTQVAKVLGRARDINPGISDVTISTSSMLLEYHLPKASSWCDLVLLGKGEEHPEVMIIELKNYRKDSKTREGDFEGQIWHGTKSGMESMQHPAAQVRQYTRYCQYFHSTVVDEQARCSGLVYFTQEVDMEPYRKGPNASLCMEFPLFNAQKSSSYDLSKLIAGRIKGPDDSFARRFELGEYKQDRNILQQVAKSLKKLKDASVRNPFVLLDGQDLGFNKVISTIENLKEDSKEVIIVSGPPGSGKSAVAANLWVECAQRFRDRGNILFVATSSSQFDPWAQTFKQYAGNEAKGMVLKANSFNPGLRGENIKDIIAPHFYAEDPYYRDGDKLRFSEFRKYLEYTIRLGMFRNISKMDDLDNKQYVSIVDEAHALIDPTAPHFSTNKAGGWCYQAGPQAWHIIKQSRVSVFLMDGRQSFRDNETTSVDAIRKYAAEHGANITEVSLEGMQFRCAGSKEYVDWVDGLFLDRPVKNHPRWADKFAFEMVDSPAGVDRWLLGQQTKSIRILSTYTREWKSRDTLREMHGTCTDHDFRLTNPDGSTYRKFWNNPNAYDIFVKATEGSTMHDDPLSEVGCPYCVRGYDYDYVGILSLGDLVRRGDRWMLDLNNSEETATGSKKKLARKEAEDMFKASQAHLPRKMRAKFDGMVPLDGTHPQAEEYATTIHQSYRILLTRGIKGVCLYVEDPETREYIKSLLDA